MHSTTTSSEVRARISDVCGMERVKFARTSRHHSELESPASAPAVPTYCCQTFKMFKKLEIQTFTYSYLIFKCWYNL